MAGVPLISRPRVCSMTSFPVDCEPRPDPRVFVAACLVHVTAAAMPWLARCPPLLAALLTLLALAALPATIGRLPGRHCRLQSVAYREAAWRVRLTGDACERPVRVAAGTRVHAGLVVLDLGSGSGRLGWLLTRKTMDTREFRRLKARLRLAC